MALLRIDDYDKQESGAGGVRSLLYNLNIGGDHGSKFVQREDEKGQLRKMFYEEGWFLSKASQAILISAHYKRAENKTAYLCARSFVDNERTHCPMCEEQYENKKESVYAARAQYLHIPFLATRRQSEPQLSGKYKILPIYMFRMTVTNYREEFKANLQRFLEADSQSRIHKSPYRIYAPVRKEGEVQKYYFEPRKEKPKHEITVDHPLIDDWLDPKTGKWLWDKDYSEIISALTIMRYARYVNPKSGEPYSYSGEYDAALEIYNNYKELFGEPRIPLTDEELAKYSSDDDEDDDD